LFVALSISADLRAGTPEGDQAAPAPPAPRGPLPTPTREDLNRPWPRGNLDDAEIAGLPRDSRPAILNWERAYTLALIRSRAGRTARGRVLAEALDPEALAEQAERYDVGDFARFRKEFLASRADDGEDKGRFRDPSGEIFALLRRLEAVEIARWNVAALENLVKVLRELIEKVSSGVSQLQLDQVDEALQLARLRFLDERGHYRDQLDALKVHLGLSPHAPIVPDKGSLAGFHDVFEEADRWSVDPKAGPVELALIAKHLPAFEDVAFDGHSVGAAFDAIYRAGRQPSEEEELLRAGTRVALANRHRGDGDDAGAREVEDARLELKVRSALRRLLSIRLAYLVEERRFVLVLRRRDQAQERLLAPPRREETRPERGELITELVQVQGQTAENQGRLVSLWIEYQALRLSLYRDLGTLPCDDWKSFHDQLTARRSADHP
jgi:hypothetical protein